MIRTSGRVRVSFLDHRKFPCLFPNIGCSKVGRKEMAPAGGNIQVSEEEIVSNNTPLLKNPWEFAGWGSVQHLEDSFRVTSVKYEDADNMEGEFIDDNKSRHSLGQFLSTAIAGNDITASCLYVGGICTAFGGVLAPVCILLVICLLFLFRSIYGEVGSALPLNGGAYNVLLNTTSKLVAACAACLTLISYVATAVVSSTEAVEYGLTLFPSDGLTSTDQSIQSKWQVYLIIGSIGVLAIFAFLNLIGIGESAGVAAIIFAVHLSVMTLLVLACCLYIFQNGFGILQANLQYGSISGSYAKDLFFGFSSALLGVSGFETSSNYIEEQKPGVFPKTLRNMWICVAIFNPTISFLSLCVLSIDDINTYYQNNLLAGMAEAIDLEWLFYIVCADGAIVLSGSVLTSFVGVTGLVRRMALDRCLPDFFVRENSLRHTPHWIIITFFLVTASLCLAVWGDVTTLSGVYSLAFLSVMSLFAIGNMILKYKRGSLPRDIRAWWSTVILGLVGVLAGLIGNIIIDTTVLAWFALYTGIVFAIVMAMFARSFILKFLYKFLVGTPLSTDWIKSELSKILDQPMVFFTKNGEPHVVNKAIQYVRNNELSNHVIVVHCYTDESKIPPKLADAVKWLDELYPKTRIDLVILFSILSLKTLFLH